MVEKSTYKQVINTEKVRTMKTVIDKFPVKRFKKQVANWSVEPYRVSTSSLRPMPNFIIIGSQKGGTTSLYNYLTQHPYIKAAVNKEVHYFDVHFDKGDNWYRSRFPFCGQDYITGEASPSYIFHPHAPKRIAELTPSVKLIALLRNPVDRAYSHYNHNLRKKRENLAFEVAIEKEGERLSNKLEKMLEDDKYFNAKYFHYAYLGRGIYVDQLKNWFNFFSKEQILILSSEDFYADPAVSYSQVLEFLKLPQWELGEYKRFNGLDYQGMTVATRKQLIDYFKPHNQRLYEFLGMSFDWDK